MLSSIAVHDTQRVSLNRQKVDQPKRTLNHRANDEMRYRNKFATMPAQSHRQFFPTLLQNILILLGNK